MDFHDLEKVALSLNRPERVRLIHSLVESLSQTEATPTTLEVNEAPRAEVSIGEAFRQLRAALEKEVVENPIEPQKKGLKSQAGSKDEAPRRFPLAPGIE